MSEDYVGPPLTPKVNSAAIVCLTVSGVAFASCGFAQLANNFLSGSLAIGGLAAVGFIYLTMGLLRLGGEGQSPAVNTELQRVSSIVRPQAARVADSVAHNREAPLVSQDATCS